MSRLVLVFTLIPAILHFQLEHLFGSLTLNLIATLVSGRPSEGPASSVVVVLLPSKGLLLHVGLHVAHYLGIIFMLRVVFLF